MKKFLAWLLILLFTSTTVFAVPNIVPVKDEAGSSSGGDVNVATVGGNAVSTGNGTTDTGTQRVTISSDSTGQTRLASNDGVDIGNVDVASSALPTGAATSANQSTIIGHVDGVEGLLTTIDSDTSTLSDAVKLEDAIHGSGDTGYAVWGVRSDAGVAFGADGDYVPFSIDASGALRVSGGGGGTQYTEDAVAAADPVGTALNLVRQDTPATLVSTDGDNVTARGSNYGALYTTLVDNAGNFVSIGGGTQYDEDVASVGGEKLTLAGAIRQDTIGSTTSADGDYANLKVDPVGRLYTSATVDAALPTGTNSIGQVTANAGTNLNTSALSLETTSTSIKNAVEIMDDWDETDRAKVNLIAGQVGVTGGSGTVDAATQRVVLATDVALPTGNNNIGDVDVATIAAGDNNIGNVDVFSVIPGTGATNLGKAEDASHTSADTGTMALSVRQDVAAALAGTDADYQPVITDALGRLWVRDGNPCMDHSKVTSAKIDTTASGNVEIVALASSQVIYVCGYSLVVDAAVDVQFIYGTGTACATGETDLTGPWGFSTNGGITQGNAGTPQFKTAASNALCIETSTGVQVSGHVTYVQTASA